MNTATEDSPHTSERPEKQKTAFSQNYLERVYLSTGIPPSFVKIKFDEIDQTGRAKELWLKTMQRVNSWQRGESELKGLLMAGSQGTGKSLALWAIARAATKTWLTQNPPANEFGIQKAPLYCKRFKNWMRFEFAPNEKTPNRWNYELIHEILHHENKAIFFDDLTLDPSHEAFRPLKEFLEILVDDLSVMDTPPKLYITTNNSEADWNKILGPQLVDRIIGPDFGICQPVKCVWKSYR